jgi:hypothetical protein
MTDLLTPVQQVLEPLLVGGIVLRIGIVGLRHRGDKHHILAPAHGFRQRLHEVVQRRSIAGLAIGTEKTQHLVHQYQAGSVVRQHFLDDVALGLLKIRVVLLYVGKSFRAA